LISHYDFQSDKLFAEQSAIAIGVSVAATVKFPEIVDVTSTFSFTGTFTNTLSTAYVPLRCVLPVLLTYDYFQFRKQERSNFFRNCDANQLCGKDLPSGGAYCISQIFHVPNFDE
jgi:hypothetical protein